MDTTFRATPEQAFEIKPVNFTNIMERTRENQKIINVDVVESEI